MTTGSNSNSTTSSNANASPAPAGDPGTISSRTLEIDGMTTEADVQKVGAALRGVTGVTTKSIKIGLAMVLADQTAFNAARAAIGVAGFRSREAEKSPKAQPAAPGAEVLQAAGVAVTSPLHTIAVEPLPVAPVG